MSETYTRTDGMCCSPFITDFPCRDKQCPDRDTLCPKMARGMAEGYSDPEVQAAGREAMSPLDTDVEAALERAECACGTTMPFLLRKHYGWDDTATFVIVNTTDLATLRAALTAGRARIAHVERAFGRLLEDAMRAEIPNCEADCQDAECPCANGQAWMRNYYFDATKEDK